MKFTTWPPLQHCWLYLSDVLFQQGDGQPFVIYDRDGNIDTRQEADGFLNQVARYGKANNLPEEKYSEDALSKIVLGHIPLSIQARFYTPEVVSEPIVNFSIDSVLHPSPVPASLILAAGFNDPLALSRQTPSQWLTLLQKWKDDYPNEASHKKLAGPVWWWAIHSVALNYRDSSMTTREFVVCWLSLFPCPLCRTKFETEWLLKNPTPENWEDFNNWISQAHDFVTSHKDLCSTPQNYLH